MPTVVPDSLESKVFAGEPIFRKNKRVEARQVIYHQGDPAACIYKIRKGVVVLSSCNASGRESIRAILGPGRVFGMPERLDDGPEKMHYPESARALEPMRIEIGFLEDFLKNSNILKDLVCEEFIAREHQVYERLERFSGLAIPEKTKYALLFLFEISGRPHEIHSGDGFDCEVFITHEEIAAFIGCVRESVSEVLKGLRKARIIKTDRRYIAFNFEKLSASLNNK